MGMLDFLLQSSSFVSLLGALVILLIVYFISSSSNSQEHGREPPGPKPLPLLGNLLLLDLKRPYNTLLEVGKFFGSMSSLLLQPVLFPSLSNTQAFLSGLLVLSSHFNLRSTLREGPSLVRFIYQSYLFRLRKRKLLAKVEKWSKDKTVSFIGIRKTKLLGLVQGRWAQD